jgi:hypothetical protein
MDTFLMELAAELFAARDRAVFVKCIPAADALPHECHGNADRRAKANPGCESVRGWLVYDEGDRGVVRFMAHSVVREAGVLIDITPSGAAGIVPFLAHPDGNEMFDLIVSRRAVVMVVHRVGQASDGGDGDA